MGGYGLKCGLIKNLFAEKKVRSGEEARVWRGGQRKQYASSKAGPCTDI